jgi:glycosyltransferase involved in cell wall biosynthesis
MSVLALGVKYNSSKTGVHRVVEQVAKELVKKSNLKVNFVCDETDEISELSVYYLQNSDYFNASELLLPIDLKNQKSIKTQKTNIIKLLSQNNNSILKILISKFYYKYLQLKEKLVSKNTRFTIKDGKNIDIYHSPFHPIPAWVKQCENVKCFITIYDLIPIIYPEYFNQPIKDQFAEIINSLDVNTYILCISESTKGDLIKHCGNRIDERKIFVTELAASELFYKSENSDLNQKVLDKYKIPKEKFILSLCTFEPRKNIELVIRSFAKLRQANDVDDLNLVLVGTKGWNFDSIFNEIDILSDLKKHIFITGFVEDNDLASIYSSALMFVYPSFYEGFGLPPLEAMKCGIPVITSNNSSLPEVVGDAGITFDVKKPNLLHELMLDLYRDPAKRELYSNLGLNQSKKFTWKNTSNKILVAYQTALK